MTVTVHRVGQEPLRLSSVDSLDGENVLPGFVLPLSKIFRQP